MSSRDWNRVGSVSDPVGYWSDTDIPPFCEYPCPSDKGTFETTITTVEPCVPGEEVVSHPPPSYPEGIYSLRGSVSRFDLRWNVSICLSRSSLHSEQVHCPTRNGGTDHETGHYLLGGRRSY